MRTLACILLTLCIWIVPVFADESGFDVSAVEDELTEEAREISGELTTDGSYDVRGAIERLYERAKQKTA